MAEGTQATPISLSALDKNPMLGHLFEGNPVDEGTKRRGLTPSAMLLLLLSRFSRVQLCATPQMAAYQAPPSMGFSRQEYWSGVPLPSLNQP